MRGKKALVIIILVVILSILVGFSGSNILKGIVLLLVAIPYIIQIIYKYRVNRNIKKLEKINDILGVVLIVTLLVEIILKIIN